MNIQIFNVHCILPKIKLDCHWHQVNIQRTAILLHEFTACNSSFRVLVLDVVCFICIPTLNNVPSYVVWTISHGIVRCLSGSLLRIHIYQASSLSFPSIPLSYHKLFCAFENLSLTVPRQAFQILLDQRQMPRPMWGQSVDKKRKTTSRTIAVTVNVKCRPSAEQLPLYGAQHRQDALLKGE